MHFEDQEEWVLVDLARITSLSIEVVAKKMMLWINQGVVMMRTGEGGAKVYTLIHHQQEAPEVRKRMEQG